nr:uncharacterized protein LOC113820009 [Penaeus vannamei]
MMRESGLVDRYLQEATTNLTACMVPPGEEAGRSSSLVLSFLDLGGVFLFMFGGAALGIVLFAGEKVKEKFHDGPKAQEVFSALDFVQSQCYNVVKQAVLNVYKRVPEAYRQDFRNYRKDSQQTFVEFIRQKQLLCKIWVESELDALEYDKLLELFGSNEPSFQSIQHNGKRMEYSSRRTGLPDTHRTVHTKSETGGDESRKVVSRGKPIFHVSVNDVTKVESKYSGDKPNPGLSPFSMTESLNVTPSFRPFCSTGFICSDELCKSSSPVTILRDSAADISLVLKEAVPNPDCYTGEMSRDARLFNVLERSSDVRCAIEIPKRRKKKRHVHVNLPKKYYERDDLKENTGNQTHFLLQEYDEPFSEVARLCPLLDHAAETRDVQPVLQFPCPLDVTNGASLQAEVRRRREQGFICPCLGPLASAAVLVLESSGLHPRVDCRRARTDAWAVRFTPWDSGQQRLRQEGTRS